MIDEIKKRGARETIYRGVKTLYFTDEQFAKLDRGSEKDYPGFPFKA